MYQCRKSSCLIWISNPHNFQCDLQSYRRNHYWNWKYTWSTSVNCCRTPFKYLFSSMRPENFQLSTHWSFKYSLTATNLTSACSLTLNRGSLYNLSRARLGVILIAPRIQSSAGRWTFARFFEKPKRCLVLPNQTAKSYSWQDHLVK